MGREVSASNGRNGRCSSKSQDNVITIDPKEQDSSDTDQSNHRILRCETGKLDKTKEKIYVYKARDGIVEIYSSNLKCLLPEAYLDDTVMRFYTAYLMKDLLNHQTANKIHVFDNYFHMRLCQTLSPEKKLEYKDKKDYKDGKGKRIKLDTEEKTKKWWHLNKWFNGVNIFEKSYLIFPICQEEHWFTVIICHPGEVPDQEQDHLTMSPEPCIDLTERPKPVPGIIVMDSLGINNRTITKEIREFLDLEWRTRLTTIKDFSHHSMPEYHPKLPTQTNAFDCGLFTLAYLKAFVITPERFYKCVRENTPANMKERSDLSEPILEIINRALKDCSRETLRRLILDNCQVRYGCD